jgi:hypothetical protein
MKEMQQLEDDVYALLEEAQLVFLLGHDTHDGLRSIYFYTNQYNEVAARINQYLETNDWSNQVVFHIRKDKYWKEMDYFFNAPVSEEEEE